MTHVGQTRYGFARNTSGRASTSALFAIGAHEPHAEQPLLPQPPDAACVG